MRQSKFSRLLLLIAVIGMQSCGPSLPPATSGGGFFIQTAFSEEGLPPYLVPFVAVQGNWLEDSPGAQGNPAGFTVTINSLALAGVPGGRAPASWRLTWVAGGPLGCYLLSSSGEIRLDQVNTFQCIHFHATAGSGAEIGWSGFSISPNPLDTSDPPVTATIFGQGFSAQYGMPLLQYFDIGGNLVAQTTATAIATDGTWVQGPTPDVSSLVSGA